MKKNDTIPIKSKEEIKGLREAGKTLAAIIEELKCSLISGVTTKDIERIAEKLIDKHQATSAFKGYRGYPASACVSVNHEVVHGIPSDKVLKPGDIVSVDLGIVVDHFYADSAFTVALGKTGAKKQKLIDVTREALYKGIEKAVCQGHLSDISHAIQSFVEANRFSVVRDFVGHGIGRSLHEEPEVPNFGEPNQGPLLKEGFVLAIEPMVNMGTWKTRVLNDGWTVVTEDGLPSAHFEHTIAITANGPEILTG